MFCLTNSTTHNRLYAFLRDVAARWPLLSAAFLAVAIFVPFKILLLMGAGGGLIRLPFLFFLCVLAFFFQSIKSKEGSVPLLIIQRGIVALFGVYLILSAPSFLAIDLTPARAVEVSVYKYLTPVLFALAIWRVSWGIPLLFLVKWQKLVLSEIISLPISVTDYSPVLELGIFLSAGYLSFFALKKILELNPSCPDNKGALSPLDGVVLTAVAVHFSNYFYSGVQKIIVAESLTGWVFDNPTYFLSYAATTIGALPITYLGDEFANTVISWMKAFVVPINALTFLSQLFAVFAITRIRLAILLTAFFDIMHVGIFLVSGIFFYKWIVLNLLIVFSLSRIKEKIIPREFLLWLVGVVIFAPFLFFVAFLGWYDTPSFNDQYIEAVTEDDGTYRVPSNYFLSGSILYAQQRLLSPRQGWFETITYAAVDGSGASEGGVLDRVMNCHLPEDHVLQEKNFIEFDSWIKRHHSCVLKNVNMNGRILYDLYPHHIFSMPWSYSDFYGLDKRKIIGYRYIQEAVCLDSTKDFTGYHTGTQMREEHYVDVR